MTETAKRTTFREVLAQPVFSVVLGVRSLAIAADTLRIVALSVLIFTTTGSAALAAVAFGIGFLPQVLGGVVLGALPDVVRPRLLMVTGYLAECAAAGVLALVELPVWASLLIVAAIACLAPVFHGSAGRLVAEVLTGDAYVLGRSLFTVASALSQLAGMAAGGIAVASIGPRHALLATAVCHLIAAVGSRLLLPDLVPAASRSGEGRLVRESWRGNRLLLGDPAVRVLLLLQWLPAAFTTGAESLLVPYAEVTRLPKGSAGFLLACVPVGMIVGDLVVARLLTPSARERLVTPLLVILGTPLIAFAFGIGPVPGGVLLFVLGAGFSYSLGIQRRFLEVIPAQARGQAFALMSTGLMTLQGIGPVVFGGLAEVIPIGTAIATAGVAILVIALWLSVRGYQTKQEVMRDPAWEGGTGS